MSLSKWLAGIFSICAALSAAQIAETPQKLPIVKSGEMPFYPPLANAARIQGDVHLRVTTDGSGVASVVVESGQPMLAKAAQDNVRTWKFEPHEPTSFSTFFVYHLRAEPKCETDKSGNGEIHLKLPTQVEITTNPRGACYDPDDELDVSEPLRVFLTGCEIDGSSVPCDKFTFRLYSGSVTVTPTRFKESERKQGFVVPKEFRTLKAYEVSVETGSGSFTLAHEDIGFLKGKWRVGIDHTRFKEETPIYNPPASPRCAGFIVYEWGEPEVAASAPCK
jgi:TonB family protein